MGDFREFKVDTYGDRNLVYAVLAHAEGLGYERLEINGDYDYGVVFKGHGKFLTVNHEVNNVDETLSLDEFFSLTKDDVVEKTELFDCNFQWHSADGLGYGKESGKLTQEKVGRILYILKQDNDNEK